MDEFLSACGAAGQIRLEITGVRQRRRRPVLARPFAVLGRAADSDIRLPNPDIQLRHAYFQLIDDRLACFDLGNRNTLRWGDGRPNRSGWLDPGTLLQIGPYRVQRLFATPKPDDNGHAPEPADRDRDTTLPHNLRWSGGGPNVVLVFPDQNGGPVRWKMTRTVTLIGRAPGCRVRLPDDSVSWYHCALVRTPAGVWVVDLLSQGGLTLNAAPDRFGPLGDGDTVAIGRFRMVIRYEDALRAATAASPTLIRKPILDPPPPPAAAVPALEPPVELPLEAELMNTLNSVRGDIPTPALVMLVEHFGQMQQQMLEQFYQSTMALVGHLDDHYRQQMHQMRDELDKLRDLSRELVELRDMIQAPPALPPPPTPTTAPALSRPTPNGHPSPTPTARATVPPAASKPSPPAATPRPSITPPTTTPAGTDDPLVLVSRRIAQIRNEQRSRWQKILDLIRPR